MGCRAGRRPPASVRNEGRKLSGLVAPTLTTYILPVYAPPATSSSPADDLAPSKDGQSTLSAPRPRYMYKLVPRPIPTHAPPHPRHNPPVSTTGLPPPQARTFPPCSPGARPFSGMPLALMLLWCGMWSCSLGFAGRDRCDQATGRIFRNEGEPPPFHLDFSSRAHAVAWFAMRCARRCQHGGHVPCCPARFRADVGRVGACGGS